MISSRENKLKLIEEKLGPLEGKAFYINDCLYKALYYSSLYLYVYEYKADDELKLDNNLLFQSENYFTLYIHFTNDIIKQKKPIKLKISFIYEYFLIIDENEINNIYFKNGYKIENYNDSDFKNNKQLIELENEMKKLIEMMYYGPMSKTNNNEYYLKYRKDELKEHFIKFGIINDIKKVILEKFTIKEPYLNCYDMYLELYEEYKSL